MTEPLIDILMATYNGERFIAEQIESIQRQSYKNWRLLVSDDCSTDGTLDVVRSYAAEDGRIRIVSEGVKHGGAKENFFSLMTCSDAPYCMFCDQDDVWLPDKIKDCLEAMSCLEIRHAGGVPLLVFCDMKVVDSNLNIIHASFEDACNYDTRRVAFKYLLAQNVAAGCSILLNRAAIDANLIIDDCSSIEMHDWWMILVVSAFGAIGYVDSALSLYRQHDNNELGAGEYAPIKRAKDTTFMLERFRSTIEQAVAFREIFGDEISPEDKRCLDFYISAGNTRSLLCALFYLFRSGCWKKGARKLGQLIVVAKSAKQKKKTSGGI